MDPNSTDPRQAPAVRRQRLRVLATTAAPSLPCQVLELAWTDILVGDAGERPGGQRRPGTRPADYRPTSVPR